MGELGEFEWARALCASGALHGGVCCRNKINTRVMEYDMSVPDRMLNRTARSANLFLVFSLGIKLRPTDSDKPAGVQPVNRNQVRHSRLSLLKGPR